MKATTVLCDRCGRSPDGDAPDFVYALACGHDLCNECLWKKWKDGRPTCPICKKVTEVGR